MGIRITIRELINAHKKEFEKRFKGHLKQYQRAVIRHLLYKKGKNGDMAVLLDALQGRLRISGGYKSKTERELNRTQALIAGAWKDYFGEVSAGHFLQDGDYEKMLSAYRVDFSEIEKKYNRIVKQEIMRAARSDYGFNTLRSRLLSRGVANAWTLANTAVNQFDNAYMTETAHLGGVSEFLYDGVLHPNSRPFCKRHFHKTYTLKELRALDNGQGLPVETSLGGFNCTHYLTPVLSGAGKE